MRASMSLWRARSEDNPIYANDVNYKKTLAALPDRLRRAFLEGDWSVLEGQLFRFCLRWAAHGGGPSLCAEDWAPRWISIDWGFKHLARFIGTGPVMGKEKN